jgi:hypothetical protein
VGFVAEDRQPDLGQRRTASSLSDFAVNLERPARIVFLWAASLSSCGQISLAVLREGVDLLLLRIPLFCCSALSKGMPNIGM